MLHSCLFGVGEICEFGRCKHMLLYIHDVIPDLMFTIITQLLKMACKKNSELGVLSG